MSNDEIMEQLKFKAAQKRVVPLIMMGLSNEEIANELYMDTSSIKFQVTLIYKLTNLDSRARLMAGLSKLGWRMDNRVKLPEVKVAYSDVPTLQVGSSKWV